MRLSKHLFQTFSLTIDGVAQHLISYYKVEDVENGRLRSPSSLPEFASLDISPQYLDKTHFRNPPKVDFDSDGVPRYRGEADDIDTLPPAPSMLTATLSSSVIVKDGRATDNLSTGSKRPKQPFAPYSLSKRRPGRTLPKGSRDVQHSSMSNRVSPTTHINCLDADSFPYQFMDMQGCPSDPIASQFQSGFGVPGDSPYKHMPQSSSAGSGAYDGQGGTVGNWEQPVIHLTGQKVVAIPSSPVPSSSMTIGSTSIYSEDPQSQPTVKDPDPLSRHKIIVFDHLQNAKSLEDIHLLIRDLVHRTGDSKYEELLKSALQERPDIPEPGLETALERRKNKQERPLFACVLCRAVLATNDNLKSELPVQFSCLIFNKTLKDHYRSHLKWDAFPCQRCGEFFHTAATLDRHTIAERCVEIETSR